MTAWLRKFAGAYHCLLRTEDGEFAARAVTMRQLVEELSKKSGLPKGKIKSAVENAKGN